MPASTERCFFDSNTLLYLAGTDKSKAERIETLVRANGVISVQVLNEVANVARRKMRMNWDETLELVTPFGSWFEVVPLTLALHEEGLRLAQRYQLSVYDGVIVAAALEADCTVLLSEDMHDGLLIEKRVRIRNPFLH
jgi:predicted nucleic acid-binding protein